MMKYRALVLIIILAGSLQLVSKGQNTGPSAPEAMSFEAPDISDMVNPLTGDFVYVLPLLEVPGPQGGYPVTLSYHGGIPMDLEASWVGLGWNLNCGAINRNVQGVADDLDEAKIRSYFFHSGGEETTISAGFGVGINQIASIGMTVNYSSSRGLGVSINGGAGMQFGNSGFKGGIGFSLSQNGASISPSLGYGGISTSLISLNTTNGINFSPSMTIARSEDKNTSTEITFSSDQSTVKMNGVGIGIATPSSAIGDITISGQTTIALTIPLKAFWLSFSYRHFHWSIFQEFVNIYSGSLYPENSRNVSSTNWGFPDNPGGGKRGMDALITSYQRNSTFELTSNNCILSAFDAYSITGLGLSGTISPKYTSLTNIMPPGRTLSYFYEDDNIKWQKRELNYYFNNWNGERLGSWQGSPVAFVKDPIYFYFDGEFSSYLEIISNNFVNDGFGNDPIGNYNTPETIDSQITLYGGNQTKTYHSSTKRKYSGNVVEWITNKDIAEGTNLESRGFIETPSMKDLKLDAISSNYIRDMEILPENGIGAFVITTPDGKLYNYSLPVYHFEQLNKTRNARLSVGGKIVENTRVDMNQYAYTWLLTSITGPDYIDLNNSGQVDVGDAGYWVRFDYGKWTDSYVWKFPVVEGAWDEYYNGDTTLRSINYGRKQVFYLDKIQTASHTAYFIKDLRKDGCGFHGTGFNDDWRDIGTLMTTTANNDYVLDINNNIVYYNGLKYTGTNYIGSAYFGKRSSKLSHTPPPTDYFSTVLLLKRIILVPNSAATLSNENHPPLANQISIQNPKIDDRLKLYNLATSYLGEYHDLCDIPPSYAYFSNLITDVNDIIYTPDILNSAIKIISFDYDYWLCPNTPNTTPDNTTKGKLTLKSVSFDYFDRESSTVKHSIPPYNFYYYVGGLGGANTPYNRAYQDEWGYSKEEAKAYDLKVIEFPTNAALQINGEEDNFSDMILTSRLTFVNKNLLSFPYGRLTSGIMFNINPFYNASDYVSVGDEIRIFSHSISFNNQTLEQNGDYNDETDHTVTAVTATSITFSPDLDQLLEEMHLIADPDMIQIMEADIGFTSINQSSDISGGGVRVKAISLVKSIENDVPYMKTRYSYNIPGQNHSSGMTMYIPSPHILYRLPYQELLPGPGVFYRFFTKEEYNKSNELISRTVTHFDLPEVATDLGEELNIPGFFRVELLQNETLYSNWSGDIDNGIHIGAKRFLIHDNLSSIGRVLSTKSYNPKDNLISETVYNYKTPVNKDQGVFRESFMSRKVNRLWSENHVTCGQQWFLNATSIIHYPSIIESTTTRVLNNTTTTSVKKYDFLTGQPTVVLTSNNQSNYIKDVTLPAYYVYPGMGSKIDNPALPNMLTQVAGSYRFTSDANASTLGLLGAGVQTWRNDTKGRQFTEDVQNNCYSYITPASQPFYRKSKSFVFSTPNLNNDGTLYYNNWEPWIVDQPYEYADWQTIFGTGNNGPWVLSNEITCYNKYSQPIESYDINNNPSAIKMGYSNTKVIGTASMTNQASFACSGFEERNTIENFPTSRDWGGEVVSSDNCSLLWSYKRFPSSPDIRTKVEPHTGNCYCSVPASSYGPGFRTRKLQYGDSRDAMLTGITYRASVWVHRGSPDQVCLVAHLIGDNCPANSYKTVLKSAEGNLRIGDWVRLVVDIEVPADFRSNSTFGSGLRVYVWNNSTEVEAYIDDFRVQPLHSMVNTYVFNALNDQLMAVLNNDNLATFFEYNPDGSLVRSYSETSRGGGKKYKTIEYQHHFKRDQ